MNTQKIHNLAMVTDYNQIVNRLIDMLQNSVPSKALLEYVRCEIVNELNAITIEEMESET